MTEVGFRPLDHPDIYMITRYRYLQINMSKGAIVLHFRFIKNGKCKEMNFFFILYLYYIKHYKNSNTAASKCQRTNNIKVI